MNKQKENVAMGFMLQEAICELNNIHINQEDKDIFKIYHIDNKYEQAKLLAKEIRKILPRNVKPQQYISNYKGDHNDCLVNFYLSRAKTMSVRIAKKGFVPPRVLGQAGIDVCNYYYSPIWGKEVETIKELKDMYMQPEIIINIIPLWIDVNVTIKMYI